MAQDSPMHVKTFVRCRTPFLPYARVSEFRALIDELTSARLELALVDREVITPMLYAKPWTDLTLAEQKVLRRLPRGWNSDTVITFEASLARVGYHLDDPQGLLGDKEEALSGVEEHEAAEETLASVRRLLFAMNLAAPGATQLIEALVMVDGTVRARAGLQYPDLLGLARRAADVNGWPEIGTLPIRNVWSWIQKINGFLDGFSQDPLSRAVNAMTHIFAAPDVGVALFWSMVGVESLFTHGEAGLLNQVRERAQLILGASSTADRLIKRMYKARSKFVHGKMDFAGAWFRFDATPDFARSRREARDACDVALGLVLATLQVMAREYWHGFRFRLEVDGVAAQ